MAKSESEAPDSRGRSEREATRVARQRMVEDALGGAIADARVRAAMGRVPRHQFVDRSLRHLAYEDQALPIVGQQTISQPLVVALCCQAMGLGPGDRCLEVGTGSGYQAAVLSELCQEVFSIEYLEEVFALGEANLRRTGFLSSRVHLRRGDGYGGWPEAAPFEGIVVAAATPQVPQPLLRQLARGGRLVLPVGPAGGAQRLELWTRSGASSPSYKRRVLLPVRFVPFLGPGIEGTPPPAPGASPAPSREPE